VQPLLVRPNCEGFEIVAGQRRYHAAVALAEEGFSEPLPCLIMEEGDDAKAIEASLAENIARLPMDEIDQYKAFAQLRGEGLDVSEIASRFGVTERLVQQRLAIAGIIEPILNAYRRDEIDAETLRILTMATAKQQKAWWKLLKDEEDYAPTGWRLKEWLFGGSQIPVSNALFDLAEYTGSIVSDLFGEERYFADSDAFWDSQGSAIAARREAYLADGWTEVVVLDVGQRFATWEHEKVAKKKGGKVFVAITHNGEVAFHEGWLSMKEAKKLRKAEAQEQQNGDGQTGESGSPVSAKPELTAKMRNYIGLHKHAAVRTELLAHPAIALRLAVAHVIAGSGQWKVEADDLRAEGSAIQGSLSASTAEAGFAEERRRIRALLGIGADEADDATIVPRQRDWQSDRSLPDIFKSLMQMEDATVIRILTFVMAETLEAHSGMVEGLGALLATDMRNWWQPDETFFDLMRDKAAINAMLREVAGDVTADAHTASTAKVQKKIVADCLSGTGREKVEGWLPGYFEFPERLYR
jgi:ParB family chromosome partitioning protein